MVTDEQPTGSADEGMAHLQAAAREMIGAARALLDAAEQLVDDPSTVTKVVSMVSDFAQAATGSASTSAASDPPHDDDNDGPVERIVVG